MTAEHLGSRSGWAFRISLGPPPFCRAASYHQSLQPSLLKAILTDAHLWVPVVVLALGIGLLFILR